MTLRPLLRFVWHRQTPVLRVCLSVELFRLLLHRNKSGNAQAAGPTYVVGFFTAPTGLGQSARLYFQELRQHGRVVHAVDVTRLLPLLPLASVQGLLPEGALPLFALNRYAGPGVVVIHANPPVFMFVLWAVRKLLPGKRVVAYWAWELEDIPAFWTRCLDWLDEVQVPSNFVANAVRKYTTKSVFVHPLQCWLFYAAEGLKNSPSPCCTVLTAAATLPGKIRLLSLPRSKRHLVTRRTRTLC